MDKLRSAQVTWQDGVKYTQDQNTSAEGLLFNIPEQWGAESLKDVVYIKQAAKNLKHNKENNDGFIKRRRTCLPPKEIHIQLMLTLISLNPSI